MIKLKNILKEAKPSMIGNMNAVGASKVLGKGGKIMGFVADTPNAIATLIQDYPNVHTIEFKMPFSFGGKTYKSIKKSDGVWKKLMDRYIDEPTKAILKKDFQLKEEKFKSPDYIITSISSTDIPEKYISKADVGLGLKMGDVLGRGWALTLQHYKLDYRNGKVALILSRNGKLAVRVKSENDPNYLDRIQKVANDYLTNFAKNIK
jgi:hypothetical protein